MLRNGLFHKNDNRIDKILYPRNPTSVHYSQVIQERDLSYSFFSHFHPYVPQLLNRLIRQSVPGLQAADTEYQMQNGSYVVFDNNYQDESKRGKPIPALYKDFFEAQYKPNPANIKDLVLSPYPVKELDFTTSGAYAVYNWELFYHIPLSIAMSLSKNGRYAEARQWFHYIFDPTDNSDGPTPERFWKVKPFQFTNTRLIEEIMINLSTGQDSKLRDETIACISKWKENPFRPHAVARYRQTAYMFKTVFAYLDNLIAWGDSDFRKDLPEDVDAALLKYVLAANILGARPQEVPSKGSVRPQTYKNLKKDLDEMGNAMRRLETDIPFNLAPPPSMNEDGDSFNTIGSLGYGLYFCIPRNEKLIGYWDTVADRLFKIRNSLNLQGIFRQLPLFAPPIDPALLARSVAAGLDVSAVVAGLNAPMPLIRFSQLLQKAAEICQEVKTLGGALLAAMEKEDNEALSILRAHHEKLVLSLAESVKYAQFQEAIKAREGLIVSLQNLVQRYKYYERLLGKKENDIKLPELSELDAEGLLKLKFNAKEPVIAERDIEIDISTTLGSEGGQKINMEEATELLKLKDAREQQGQAAEKETIGAGLALVPEIGVDFHFWGMGGRLEFGGSALSRAMSFWASFARAESDKLTYEGNNTAKLGSYARREQEWTFQSNTIAGEINQIYKQIRGAQIREAIAEREWKNHQQQIKNAEEIENFLTDEKTGKKTNKDLYLWMKRETKGLYNQCFQFAFDVAKKAERALQQELGDNTLSYIQYNYTGGKEGLLAGEKLFYDLKKMEMAYHELNLREYELTKQVSLLQLDPVALLQLRTTGRCAISLPEALFDMDGPGHYFRRIKNVAVSIPCIAGPYTSVNCTLTLTKSTIRKRSTLSDGDYVKTGDNDDRFDTYLGSMQSIVTSSAMNDSGMFETNLKDERKLPFEYSGVVSEWVLSLPGREGEVRQFNYDSISDVILHIRYTAREGGELLRKGAMKNLKDNIEAATAVGSTRLFSIRHEFPNEWEKFKAVVLGNGVSLAELTLPLREEHYPLWSKGSLDVVHEMAVYARTGKNSVTVRPSAADNDPDPDVLTPDKSVGGLKAKKKMKTIPAAPTGSFSLFLDDNTLSDLWIAISWGK